MHMPRYGVVLLVALLRFAGLVALYCRAQSSMTEQRTKHSKWDYLLVWPLILRRAQLYEAANSSLPAYLSDGASW